MILVAILMGAFFGGLIGFGMWAAIAGDGDLVTLVNQFETGMWFGFIGLVVGAFLGRLAGWAVKNWTGSHRG